MKIKVMADSTCDLNKELIERYQIGIMPLSIIKDGQSYLDGVSITPDEVMAHADAGGALCGTAAINMEDYRARFEALSREYDAVIHINIGAEFSGCFEHAARAAQEFPSVYAFDSRNLSTGSGLLVLEAAEMALAGERPKDILERLSALRDQVDASFILDQLEYMRRGGRCSAVAALGANLLRLRPCIEVQDGRMAVCDKYRGVYDKCVRKYVLDRLSKAGAIDRRRAFLTHTPVPASALKAAREALAEEGHFKEVLETTAGCTVSSHCGPGTLGVLFVRA